MEAEPDRSRLTISEAALDGLFQRVLDSPSVRTEYVYAAKTPGFSRSEVRLEVREGRVRALRRDGGALRLVVSARAVFRYGFGVPDHQIDLRCTVLIRPEITRCAEGGLIVRVDVGSAKLRDLHVEQRARGGLLGFDPTSLDPFADDRLRETARLAIRAALRRFGVVEGRLSSLWFDRVIAGVAGDDALAFSVRDGEVEVAAFRDSSRIASADPTAPTTAARFYATDALTTHLVEALVTDRASPHWQLGPIAARSTSAGIEIEGGLRPAAPAWPSAWRLGFLARVSPHVAGDAIGLGLDDLVGVAPPLPRRLTDRVRAVLAARLSTRSRPRVFSLRVPFSDEESWRVEVSDVKTHEGLVEIVLDADL